MSCLPQFAHTLAKSPNGRIRIDVIVLGLDPEAVYTYRIPPDPGPGGFQLSGRRFRPLTVRDGLIRIQELPASP